MYNQTIPLVPVSHYQPFLQPIMLPNTQCVPRTNFTDDLTGYTFLDLLGKGGFGKVYLAEKKVDKHRFAVKFSMEDTLKHEYNLLIMMSHPNIVTCHGLYNRSTNWYLVMEWMDKGSIKRTLETHGPLSELYVKYITRQVLNGLEHLFSLKIVHRDIKADNILLNLAGVVKIGDFGIAIKLNPLPEEYYGLQTKAGTPSHLAPEVLLKGSSLYPNCPYSYGAPVDIWSLGCTVMEMLTGRCPNSEGYFKSIYWGHPPFYAYRPANISINCWSFIEACLYPDPNVRLPAELLKIHQWQIFC